MEEFGPVQVLVVGFDGTTFKGEILPEFQRLKELDIVRLVDMVVVSKDQDGEIFGVELSDLSDEQREGVRRDRRGPDRPRCRRRRRRHGGRCAPGAEAAEDGVLGEETMWSIADTIPMGTTAAVALIEHRWAIPLRDAIRRAGGVPLADSWIHPEDLIAIGAASADAG